MNKLFIDDIRNPPDNSWFIARSSEDAKNWIFANHTLPDIISFDHDLGGDDTAMVFIHWMINSILDGVYQVPESFEFKIHSANPVGRENINSIMKNFLEFIQ